MAMFVVRVSSSRSCGKQQRNGAREKETQEVELGKAAVTNTHTYTHSDIKKPSKSLFFSCT